MIDPYCLAELDECHRTILGKGAFQNPQLHEKLVPFVAINHPTDPSAAQPYLMHPLDYPHHLMNGMNFDDPVL